MMAHSSLIDALEKNNGFVELWEKPPLNCIKSENYQGENVFDQYGRESGWKLLRGSKLRRQHRYGDYARKYEYQYHFASWMGARFANRFYKTGQRVIRIGSEKGSNFLFHHGVSDCFTSSFKCGFRSEFNRISGNDFLYSSSLRERELNLGITQSQRYEGGSIVSSAVYIFFLQGLDEEKKDSILSLIHESADLDEIEQIARLE